MKIGIGLPTTIPGVDGRQGVEWAQRAERAGFSTLGVLDRIVYPNYEPLVSLAAAAAVTERIHLTTGIVIAPYRANTALLAKQVATVQALSGGRLELGVAVGFREDDYEASGVPMKGRGQRFEEMLDEMKRIWAGEERGFAGAIGPEIEPPTLLIGGMVDAAFRRAAEYGDGWIMGGGGPDGFGQARGKLLAAWERAGREGPRRPRWPTSGWATRPRRTRAAASATTTPGSATTRTRSSAWWPRPRRWSGATFRASRRPAATS
jgi:alkanesulfonate monooxygenase SsuD/methylene tetrahydromethanopterin reductase-like flavin-dependent oxidoreductase (luciferase family)